MNQAGLEGTSQGFFEAFYWSFSDLLLLDFIESPIRMSLDKASAIPFKRNHFPEMVKSGSVNGSQVMELYSSGGSDERSH